MNTDPIRTKVSAAINHEQRTGDLMRRVRDAVRKEAPELDANALDARTATVVTLITDFVGSMPDIIDATVAAAETAGAHDLMAPIFQQAVAYIEEEVDFIPDRLGLAGLVDDAYLIRELMQELSHRHRMATGRPLIPVDQKAENAQMRRLIGEPTATRIDAAIIAFARRQEVRSVIDQIMARIGGQQLTMQLPISKAFLDSGAPKDDLPDLQLGQLAE